MKWFKFVFLTSLHQLLILSAMNHVYYTDALHSWTTFATTLWRAIDSYGISLAALMQKSDIFDTSDCDRKLADLGGIFMDKAKEIFDFDILTVKSERDKLLSFQERHIKIVNDFIQKSNSLIEDKDGMLRDANEKIAECQLQYAQLLSAYKYLQVQ